MIASDEHLYEIRQVSEMIQDGTFLIIRSKGKLGKTITTVVLAETIFLLREGE